MTKHCNYRVSGVAAFAVLLFLSASVLLAAGQTSITTYHYDNYRTGWNQNETTLTPANVGPTTFGLLQTVALDDQVDAQPLVMPGVLITAGNYQGTHDVVYVATENNTVYAIDVHTGTVLLNPNFGTPVSQQSLPGKCNNNGPNVGITSTPVIDPSSNTLYVMTYTQGPSAPAYTLHALDLGSLTDKMTPQVVAASHTLTDGTTFNFSATYQRQRPALLLANGSIYAGFGSFCDKAVNLSRGWLLGWTAGSLAPFPSNQLNDLQPAAKKGFFLSSIWMSGYGPAADDAGNVLFVTGNSESGTYDGVTNIQESVVKMSNTLTTVMDLFTPDNQATMDQKDSDFGSGGVLVLPDQPGSLPHLAVAAGKDGNLYLMNEDGLGGYSPSANNVLGTYSVGRCWCGQSYFVDPLDGLGRVVTSGGRTAMVWKVQTSPTVALTRVAVSPATGGTQDPGFFTTISSNGLANPIIWALSHPVKSTKAISLFAFNPESGSKMKKLFLGTAGVWPNLDGNANLVPVVANGLVFVASNQQLQIFGLTGAKAKTKKK
jgi:outer membrane protein assembly factor BamB